MAQTPRPVTDEEFFAFLASLKHQEPAGKRLMRWFVRGFFAMPYLLFVVVVADSLMRGTVGALPCFVPMLLLLTVVQGLMVVGSRRARVLWKKAAADLGLHFREEGGLIWGMVSYPQIYGKLGGRPVWIGIQSDYRYMGTRRVVVNHTLISATLRHPMAEGEVRDLQLGNKADEPELRALLGEEGLGWLRERAELDTLRLGAGRIAFRMFESPGTEAEFEMMGRSLRLVGELAARLE